MLSRSKLSLSVRFFDFALSDDCYVFSKFPHKYSRKAKLLCWWEAFALPIKLYWSEKMSLFQAIKAAVTTRQAAENFVLTVDKHGMALCPFHDDHIPSLKLDKRYYCFACGESGDVISFTAKLLGVSPYSAAIRLARDFGIDPRPPTQLQIPGEDTELIRQPEQPGILSLAQDVQRYRRWKRDFAPASMEDPYDDRFVEGCRNLAHAEYLLDCTLEAGCAA
jgi:hypothetical protein